MLLVSSNAVGARVEHHRNVIDAAARAGVALLAYTSVLRADTSSLGLAVDHLATEDALKQSGVPFTLLRNGWYTENYTENTAAALASGQVLGAAGEGRISAATRRDFAEAAAVVLAEGDHAGAVYELAGDDAFTMAEYAAALGAASGPEIGYTDLPAEEYAAALESAGVPAPFAQLLAGSDVGIAAGDLEDRSGTLSRLIGRPTTPLADAPARRRAGNERRRAAGRRHRGAGALLRSPRPGRRPRPDREDGDVRTGRRHPRAGPARDPRRARARRHPLAPASTAARGCWRSRSTGSTHGDPAAGPARARRC